jgi:hypothetical protein
MGFKKISKSEWDALSQEDKDYFNLEFNKSVENRKRLTLIVTRTIAIVCIFVLFWIGFVQFRAVENYNSIIDRYGSNGYCYLCGQTTLKSCECQYFTSEFVLENRDIFENYSIVTAQHNTKDCGNMKLIKNGENINQFLLEDINISI